MKVVFLDVDGVLNSESFYDRKVGRDNNIGAAPTDEVEQRQIDGLLSRNFVDYDAGRWLYYLRSIDPGCVARLNTLIAATGAKVILSSAWRRILTIEEMTALLQAHGFTGEIIDHTPTHLRSHNGGTYVNRGLEIDHWLSNSANETVESFVILDDNGGMDPVAHAFVQTDFEIGLTDADVARAVSGLVEGWEK